MLLKKIWIKFQNSQFSKFVFVGVLNTIVGYGFFAFFVLIGLHYSLALILSSVIGIIHSYFWNKYFTFKSFMRSFFEFFRFVSVYLVIFLLNWAFLWIFVDIYSFNILQVQAGVIIFLTICSFLGHKFWSFRF